MTPKPQHSAPPNPVCDFVYDENAERLYGLTESRFLHDEEGVKSKFHPDDMEVNVVKGATGAPSPRAMAATTRNIPGEAARWQLAVAERVGRVEFDGEEVCPPHESGQRPPRH